MKLNSVKVNAFLNVIRIAMSVLFPLITFPYASQVLGVSNLGKVQFATSVVSYFALIAALGVQTYGTREGSKVRENQEKFNQLCSEIFTVNIISTIIAYVLLIVLVLLPTKIQGYKVLIFIQSIVLILTTLGVDWVYASKEDFYYVTVKSIIAQVISIILLFLFVRHKNDYYIYSLTTVVAASGMYISTFLHSKKYVHLKLIFAKSIFRHLKPMFILFSNNLAISIYVNSDVLMLGLFATDLNVGLYSVSVKIYSVVKSLLNAITLAVLPRLSLLSTKENKEEYFILGEQILHACIILILPAIVGLFLLSKDIILLLSGPSYLSATSSLKLLTLALGFSVLANFFVNAILIINNEEKYALNITLIAGIVNIALNFIMIPLLKQDGAAITTIIAECIVAILSGHKAKKYMRVRHLLKVFIQSAIGCVGIYFVYFFITRIMTGLILNIILIFLISIIVYFLILLILGNDMIKTSFSTIKSTLHF